MAGSRAGSARQVGILDRAHGSHLTALGSLRVRTESVASSKIEQIEASADAYARALHGNRSNAAATAMVAASEALTELVASVAGGAELTLASLLRSHGALMKDDPAERTYAGRLRDMQNWIGGSDHSPRNALYVPPPPETVAASMDDLVAFANRDDLSALGQAALVHAQFESIHPFTHGNGRIGRALVNTVLRRRGVTGSVVGPIRRGSTPARLLASLTAPPVFSADEAERSVGGPTSSVYAAIERFAAAGVLRPLTDRKRNQVWGVADLLDELDDLNARIAAEVLRR